MIAIWNKEGKRPENLFGSEGTCKILIKAHQVMS